MICTYSWFWFSKSSELIWKDNSQFWSFKLEEFTKVWVLIKRPQNRDLKVPIGSHVDFRLGCIFGLSIGWSESISALNTESLYFEGFETWLVWLGVSFGIIGLRTVFRDLGYVHFIDWNLCVKFGCDPECLSMIQTHSTKFECLTIKRRFWSSIRGFDFIRGISSLWTSLNKVLRLSCMIGRVPEVLDMFRSGCGPSLDNLLLSVLVSGVILRERDGIHAFAKKDFWLLGIYAPRSRWRTHVQEVCVGEGGGQRCITFA